MKKSLLIIIPIICLISGLIIENKFNLIPNVSGQNNEGDVLEKKPEWGDEFSIVDIKSPIDGHNQKAYFFKTNSSEPQPLIVSLHTWSNDYTQYDSINVLSVARGFNYIHPNFRGANNHKDACCSDLAIADIDASIDYALNHANVDTSRIFVIGVSGGGYATLAMFMKSKHRIKKFSSWVPLVDLTKWFEESKIRKLKYSEEILACTESTRGILNKKVALEKSPIYWETPTEKLKYSRLEIFAGVYDGMTGNGTIPITHSINFYNKLQNDLEEEDSSKYVSELEKLTLLEHRKPLSNYGAIAGRAVILLKESNNIRLTLFEGGHEILNEFAFEDLVK